MVILFYLLQKISKSGHKIIGVDLVEVGGGDHATLDHKVAIKALYELCVHMWGSHEEK